MLDKIKETAIKIKELLQTNDKRCQDLLDFIEWGILNLPEDFRNNFTSDNIMPPKHGQLYVEFNKKIIYGGNGIMQRIQKSLYHQ